MQTLNTHRKENNNDDQDERESRTASAPEPQHRDSLILSGPERQTVIFNREAAMRTKTNVKAGRLSSNHNIVIR